MRRRGEKETDAATVVEDFVTALNNHDVDGAANLTSYPNAARAAISQMFDGLEARSTDFDVAQVIDLGSDSGFFTLDAAWNFGEGKDWTYQSQGEVRDLSVGWRVSWDPSVIVPGLGSGSTVDYTRTDAAPPKVVDATGTLLMNEQTINAITIDPAATPDPVDTTRRLAKVIEPVAPLVTSESMLADLAAHPGQPVTAVLLRDPDYLYLESDFAIPGVVVVKTPKLIASDRRINSPLLDPLRTAWQANRDATAGWAVNLVDQNGAAVKQAGFQGPPGPDVAATMDSHTQLAAIEAVVSAGTPAAIVAIRPRTARFLLPPRIIRLSSRGRSPSPGFVRQAAHLTSSGWRRRCRTASSRVMCPATSWQTRRGNSDSAMDSTFPASSSRRQRLRRMVPAGTSR